MLAKISMSQRRSNLEIVAEILRIARKGAKKTRIVYGANMNFKMLDEYLEKLEKAGLIASSEGSNGGLIKTTEKGIEYLQRFSGLQEFGVA
jgi:predicted transcriptional regulator